MRKFVLLFVLFLAACAPQAPYESQAIPTPASDRGLELFVAAQQAQATAAAADATQAMIGAQITATQVAYNAQATEMRYRDEQAATQQAFDATVQAGNAQATGTVQAQQAQATAAAQATATAFPMTATRQAIEATQTQNAANATATMAEVYGNAQATAIFGQAKQVELAVRRETMTNNVIAWAPWALVLFAFGLVGYILVKAARTRVIQKDAFGVAPLIMRDDLLIEPELLTGPGLQFLPNNQVKLLPGSPDVVARAQAVRAIRAMPPKVTPDEQSDPLALLFGASMGQPQLPAVQVIPAANLGAETVAEITGKFLVDEEPE